MTQQACHGIQNAITLSDKNKRQGGVMATMPSEVGRDYELTAAIGIGFSKKDYKKDQKWLAEAGDPWEANTEVTNKFARRLMARFLARPLERTTFEVTISGQLKASNYLPQKLEQAAKSQFDDQFFENIASDIENGELSDQLSHSKLKQDFVMVLSCITEVNFDESKDYRETTNYFMVSMLRDSDALRFNKKNQVDEVDVIDFNNLLQCARINLDDFADFVSEQVELGHVITSMSTSDEVRKYFYQLLGAEFPLRNAESFDNLTMVISDYLEEYLELGANRIQELESDMTEFYLASAEDDTVYLSDIESHLLSKITGEERGERSSLVEYINEKEVEINESIIFNKKLRDKITWVNLSLDGENFKIRKSDIGLENEGKPVTYFPDAGRIRIEKGVDQRSRERLDEILKAESDT